uniref:Uncharacterized protein n=1 Tax=Glossina austeni TaxID=7395 RepID=A0A1A9V5U1_GLOAU
MHFGPKNLIRPCIVYGFCLSFRNNLHIKIASRLLVFGVFHDADFVGVIQTNVRLAIGMFSLKHIFMKIYVQTHLIKEPRDSQTGIEITEKHTNKQFKTHFGCVSNDEGDGVGKIIADGALIQHICVDP